MPFVSAYVSIDNIYNKWRNVKDCTKAVLSATLAMKIEEILFSHAAERASA